MSGREGGKGGEMNEIEICPVCSGSGELRGDDISKYGYIETPGEARICHGCGGDGWVINIPPGNKLRRGQCSTWVDPGGINLK